MCTLLLVGCQRQEPQFVESEAAKKLHPDARQAVKTSLTDLFGTVNAPRSRSYFPMDRGGQEVDILSIEQRDAQERIVSLKIAHDSSESPLLPGEAFEILLDEDEQLAAQLKGQSWSSSLSSFDPATGLLTLETPLTDIATAEHMGSLQPYQKLEMGRSLYGYHCAMCHGLSGDGHGPQSQVLNPKPRDFRLGIFKYTSTHAHFKASTEDLQNIIKSGIGGTGMPAFKLLAQQEVAAIAEYVKYLAFRGELEQQICVDVGIDFSQEVLEQSLQKEQQTSQRTAIQKKFEAELKTYLTEDFPVIVHEISLDLADRWKVADLPENRLTPQSLPLSPESRSRDQTDLTSLGNGKRLYHSRSLQCAACHGEAGHGDGEQTRQFQIRPDGSRYDQPGLHDAWGQLVKPRDLAYGVFHGGREPIDLYRRIAAGVKGTPMPAYGGQGLTEAQIWDLVNYLYFLAGEFPNLSPDTLP